MGTRSLQLAGLAAGACILVLGCGSGGTKSPVLPITTVPASWGGIWETTTILKDCAIPPNELYRSTSVDTLCAGKAISAEFDFTDQHCVSPTVTATANGISVSCSATYQDTCGTAVVTASSTQSFNITINSTAGTVSGGGHITVTHPSGSGCQDVCANITFIGTRTSTSQVGCMTNKTSWLASPVRRAGALLAGQ